MSDLPEPWLRGPIPGLSPLIAPILYAFQQAREDLARFTEGLSTEQIWARPHGFGPVGFHLRHIAGSVERLMMLPGRPAAQTRATGRTERGDGAGRHARRIAGRRSAPRWTKPRKIVRRIDPATLAEPRGVGRKQLPTTVIGLLTHIAEHTQRHVGKAISAAKLARLG